MEPKEYPYVFFNSPSGGYLGLFVGSVSFVFAASAGMQSSLKLALMAGSVLVGVISWSIGLKILMTTKALLKLGPNGIWTAKLGFLPWKHIQVVLDSFSSGKAGSFEILIIKNRQSQVRLEVITLAGLSGPTEKLSYLLQQYKRS
ncbi:hypothetical protein [Hymenobacter sp. BT190]|uniref:hypothetical protein n=1 Tax=Hymenobacter sp. BT190 TaxID=2763505 RepID=UPI0016519FBE|nr:hypothetical protein [Hymenobacter sp. BT190]MBC6697522.1 hypothetical protein [Hymenobacter sp. BT190]